MATIRIQDITVSYGSKQVLKNLSFSVSDGACCAILGPSACGKTTIARAVCGFNKLEQGEIFIGDTLVSSRPKNVFLAPEKRSIGVVFQDYAVWPHMTVFENTYYPLKKKRVEKEEALRRARKALEQVQMWAYRDRLPSQLSGGQQQRVAIARALVVGGEVIILDEPITNLDANLREEMRFEIKELQRRTGITVLYITQDQSDAMAIADQIVILDPGGNVRQIGTPEHIYKQPADSYVYQFLGVSNFLPLIRSGRGYQLRSEDRSSGAMPVPVPEELHQYDQVYLASRPMDIELRKDGLLVGQVKSVSFLGNIYDIRMAVGDTELRVHQGAYEAQRDGLPKPGDRCGISFMNPQYYDRFESDSKPGRVEPGRADPGRAVPGRAEPDRLKSGRKEALS